MSAATSTPARKTQDWAARTIRESQDALRDTVSIWAGVLGNAAPVTKSVKVPRQVPSAASVINPTFDFAEKILEVQRAYVTNLVSTFTTTKPPARKTSTSS